MRRCVGASVRRCKMPAGDARRQPDGPRRQSGRNELPGRLTSTSPHRPAVPSPVPTSLSPQSRERSEPASSPHPLPIQAAPGILAASFPPSDQSPRMPEFCHLHCHTRSTRSSTGPPGSTKLIGPRGRARAPGRRHHPTTGICTESPSSTQRRSGAGVQPVVGCEFYVTPSGMGDTADRTRYHQVLLAKDPGGVSEPHRPLRRRATPTATTTSRGSTGRRCGATAPASSRRRAASRARCCRRSSERVRTRRVKCSRNTSTCSGTTTTSRSRTTRSPSSGGATPSSLRWGGGVRSQSRGHKRRPLRGPGRRRGPGRPPVSANGEGPPRPEPDAVRERPVLPQVGQTRCGWRSGRAWVSEGVFKTEAAVDAALDATREIADKCRLEIPMGELLMPHFPIPPEHADAGRLPPRAHLRRCPPALPARSRRRSASGSTSSSA